MPPPPPSPCAGHGTGVGTGCSASARPLRRSPPDLPALRAPHESIGRYAVTAGDRPQVSSPPLSRFNPLVLTQRALRGRCRGALRDSPPWAQFQPFLTKIHCFSLLSTQKSIMFVPTAKFQGGCLCVPGLFVLIRPPDRLAQAGAPAGSAAGTSGGGPGRCAFRQGLRPGVPRSAGGMAGGFMAEQRPRAGARRHISFFRVEIRLAP